MYVTDFFQQEIVKTLAILDGNDLELNSMFFWNTMIIYNKQYLFYPLRENLAKEMRIVYLR